MKTLKIIFLSLLGLGLGWNSSRLMAQCTGVVTLSNCNQTYTRSIPATSSWNPSSQTGCSTSKAARGEGAWTFTPTYSGNYNIFVASVSGTTSSPDYNVYFRQGTCSSSTSGWTCVGSRTSASTSSPAGTEFLLAGQQYTFMLDWRQAATPGGNITVGLRVSCVSAPPDPCDNTVTMSYCGSTYTRTLSMNSAWNGSTSGNCTSFGTTRGENTWRFTPQFSGNYPIYLASLSGSTTSSSYFNVYYRSGSCSNSTSGWTCIDYRTSASTFTPVGTVFLQAGTQYQFLVDWRRSTAPTADATVGLRVGCYTPPDPCSGTPPTLSVCTGTTTTRNFTGNSGSSSYQSYCSGYGYGEEYVYRFTTQGAGNYQINVTSISGSGSREVAYKLKQSTICSSSGWSCLGSRSTSGTINMNNLAANTTYLLMLDAEERAGDAFSHTFRIECPPCSDIQSIACGLSYSANLPMGSGAGWDVTDCNFQNTPGTEKMYLFYPTTSGTYDFNVTNATGTIRYFYKQAAWGCDANNWNCIGTASSPSIFTVSLTANVPYYILADGATTQAASHYFTLECLDPCQGYPTISSCGIPVTANMSASSGAGWMNACGNHTGAGKERIFQYTPQISGPYSIQVNQSTGPMTYYYKPLSQGCGNLGWTCIDAMPSTGTSQTISLTAGTSYLILVDGENPAISSRQDFEITCAPHDPCLLSPDTLYCGQVSSKLFANGPGAGWNLQGCSGQGSGKEYLFHYTPIQSGTYDLEVVSMNTVRNSFHIRQYSSTCDTSGFTCVGTANAPGTVGTVSLQGGTTYTIAVVNDSTTFGTVDFRIQGNALQSVTGLSVSARACTDLTLGWVADTFAIDFELEAATDSLFTQIVHQFTGYSMGPVDTFVVGGLLPATRYYFRVRPIYPCGNGTYSAFVTDTTAGTPVNLVGLNNGPLCEGISPTLSLTATSNFSGPYEWTHPNTQITVQNANLSPVFLSYAGVWTVSVFTSNCGWISDTTHVTIIPNPASIQLGSNSPVCQFGTLNLTAASRSGVSYAWSGPNGFTSALQNPTRPGFTAQDTGVYSLTVTQSGCGSAVLTTHVSIIGAPILTLSSNSPVCAGGSTALQLSAGSIPGAGYYWSGPSGYTTVQQNPAISSPTTANSGVYTLVVTDACSNLYSDTISFWVDPGIVNPQVSSNTPVCTGGNLTLSASLHSGASYFWQGPGGFTSASQNPVLNNVQSGNAGVYTLTISTSGCPSATLTETVSVSSSLTVTSGNNGPFCSGGTSPLNLSVTTVNGGSYSWTGPNGFTSAQQNPVISTVTNAEAGYYYVTVSSSCGTATDSTLVAVNAPATNVSVTANSPICTGSQLSLSASSHTGATYFWEGPGGYTASGQFPVRAGMTQSESGVYSLTVTVPVCGAVSTTRSVSVLSSPTASATSNSPVCSGGVLYLYAGFVSGSTYSWAGPNGFTSNLQNPSIPQAAPGMTGNYSLTVSSIGCGASVSVASVQVGAALSSIQSGGPTPICQGNTLLLTSTLASGATYAWSGPAGFTSSSSADSIPNASISNSGVYSLVVNSPGCGTVTRTVTIAVNSTPVPAPGSNSPICAGGAIQLTANPASGASYLWQGPNGYSANTLTPAISNAQPNRSGVYTLTVTVPNCAAIVGTTTVVVSGNPGGVSAGSNTPVCAGQNLLLTATSLNQATYNWSGPSGFTSALQNPVIASAQTLNSGAYTLQVSSPGCAPATRIVNVSVQDGLNLSAGSNAPLCAGGNLVFNASTVPNSTYAWSGPNGFSSTVQNPAISNAQTVHAGTYSLIVTSQACGTASTTVAVSINSGLSGVTAAGNSPVCAGGSIQLTGSTHTGATYSWTGPNGFTSSLQSPTITPVTLADGGNYIMTVSTSGCTPVSRTVTIVVNNGPSFVPGNNGPLCAGAALNLTVGTVAGGTYLWAGPNGFSSTLQNPSLINAQPAQSGVYSLSVSVSGCASVQQTTSVVVSANPSNATILSNTPVCTGNTITLSATHYAGATYAWSGPAGFTSSSSADSIPNASTSNSGVYSLVVNSPGCGTVTRTVTIAVNSTPVPAPGSNSPICAGGAIQLTANPASGASYLWQGPNGYSANTLTPAISNAQPNRSGVYTLTVTVPNCAAIVGTTTVVVSGNPGGVSAGSNTPVCAGQNLLLTATSLNQATYSWSGPSGFTSALQNPVIASAQTLNSGAYTLQVSSPGCAPATRIVNVSVQDGLNLSAGSNAPLCAGGNLVFNASTVPNSNYAWSGPNGFSSTVQNPAISNAQTVHAGTYSLIVTSQACGTASTTVAVYINSGLSGVTAAGNSPVCAGGSIQLTGSTHTGATYSWTGPNGFTSSLQSPTITPVTLADGGNYIMTVSTSGCTPVSRTVTIVVNNGPSFVPGNNGPLCAGAALNLTVGTVAGGTYLWTGPNGFSSTLQNPSLINAQPAQSGVYSLSVSVSGCASVQQTTSVVISANPSSATALTNAPVCTGNTLNLSATQYVGATYSWTGPNGFTASVAQPSIPNVTASASGAYYVTITSGICPVATKMTSLSVLASPVVSPGNNTPICQGNSISLTTPAVSGGTYAWTGPNGFASAVQNPSISNATPLRTGIYTLIVSTTSCGTFSGTTSVVVGQSISSATVTTNSPVCVGGTIGLTATANTTATYLWTGPNGFTGNTQIAPVNPVTLASAGVYTLQLSSPGCGSRTLTPSIRVNDPASVTANVNTPLCVGNAAYFTGTAPSGSLYSWTGPASFSSTVQNPARSNVQLSHGGIYTLTATVPGCGTVQAFATLVVNPCRVTSLYGEDAQDALAVFPNPFTEYLTVESKDAEITLVELLDVSGKVLRAVEGVSAGKVQVSAESLPSGTYLLRVTSGEEVFYRKVIKQ